MQVTPVVNYNNKFRPSFQSNSRVVRDKVGNLLYRNTTNFFRSDLNWEAFVSFLHRKYKNADKVNTYCFGCSDGSEPMSLFMLLKEKFPHDNSKFFPIQAKDIDNTIIYWAKGEYSSLGIYDYEMINMHTGQKFDKYFKMSKQALGEDPIPVKKMMDFNRYIQYSVGNISHGISTIPSENSIVMCRNFWPYLRSNSDKLLLARQLAAKLKNNCTVVVGNYDRSAGAHKLLRSVGFIPVDDIPNVFENSPKSVTLW